MTHDSNNPSGSLLEPLINLSKICESRVNDNPNHQCRICLEYEGEMMTLECKCKDNYIHFNCAYKWYASKTKLKISGYLESPKWSVVAECICEICKGKISQHLLNKFIYEKNPNFLTK